MSAKTKKSEQRGLKLKYRLKEPSFYKVIMLNDDVTDAAYRFFRI